MVRNPLPSLLAGSTWVVNLSLVVLSSGYPIFCWAGRTMSQQFLSETARKRVAPSRKRFVKMEHEIRFLKSEVDFNV